MEAASKLKPTDPDAWLAAAQTCRKLKREPAAEPAIGKAEARAAGELRKARAKASRLALHA